MNIRWKLRTAAAQREVWTGSQLRRLLAERAGLQLSSASVSALFTKQPSQLKLTTLAALCTALECTPNDLFEVDTTPVPRPAAPAPPRPADQAGAAAAARAVPCRRCDQRNGAVRRRYRDCAGCGEGVGLPGRDYCSRCWRTIARDAAKASCPRCGRMRILDAGTGACAACSRRCASCGGPAMDAVLCRLCRKERERGAPSGRPESLPALRLSWLPARRNRLVRTVPAASAAAGLRGLRRGAPPLCPEPVHALLPAPPGPCRRGGRQPGRPAG